MERVTLIPANEADWLAMREQDVTSTEVAALFGASPYLTEFELYHRKIGAISSEVEENERMRWGKRLEAAIAEGVAEDLGLIVEPFKTYMRIPELRMGSSFDYKIVGLREGWSGDETFRDLFRVHGPGIMEVKNVDGLAFRRGWLDGTEIEAPLHIELQVQHQLEVSGLQWGVIAPLIGGNTPKPFARIRDEVVAEAVRKKVAEFWQRVDQGIAPDPDFLKDASVIGQLYGNDDGTEVDMSDNAYLAVLCDEYQQASKEERAAADRKRALKAEILTIIGPHAKVKVGDFSISAKAIADNPGKLVTPEMVGTYIGGRKGYRDMRISAKKLVAA